MNDAEETPEGRHRPDQLETYRRLVELQSQIVELARRNDEAERSCRLLRERLAQGMQGRPQNRIRHALLGLLQRVRTRKALGLRTRIDGEDAPGSLTRKQSC